MRESIISTAVFLSIVWFIGTIGVLVLYTALPSDVFAEIPMRDVDMARRWDSSCLGWTRGMVLQNLVGHLVHWYCYLGLGVLMLYVHPKSKAVKHSHNSNRLAAAFIIGCGLTHLMDVYTAFVPDYQLYNNILLANSVLSVLATFFITYALFKYGRYRLKQAAKNNTDA